MKKIVFVLTTMRTGGISTALCNLLYELVRLNKYEISLLLFDQQSLDNVDIPSEVKIVDAGEKASVIALSLKECLERSKFLAMRKLVAGLLVKLFNQNLVYKWLFTEGLIEGDWDCAISYSQSAPSHFLYGGCNEFVLNKINSKKKVAFIHCDYVNYGLNTQYSHDIYKQFDTIACVSKSVKSRFLSVEKDLSEKTTVVYNCHNFRRILEKSLEEEISIDSNKLNFVTVARLSVEKGHDRTLEAFGNLKKQGYDFIWHIVGGSNDSTMERLKALAEKYNLNDNIIFYGNRKNPYSIMRKADWLLVPSLHEAAPIVYTEAAVLGVPTITTNTTSAIEFVQERGWGKVCENSTSGIEQILKETIDDYNSGVRYEMKYCEASNVEAVKSITEVIEG
ncbi:MAG: glycosyltransferase [Clostridia bacterium]|nr:glycosyltransferase [Clostridia bacterium]